ncbi:hypothetical protein [Vibrio jasicida]|uniref:hypothetical protein n=1 Tax=Vibrio jasicida TaxID=766224 RepID=UPI0005F0B5A5|nr:hypothetical protein [Vibrio jasicida]
MKRYAIDIFYSSDATTLIKVKKYVEQTYKTQCETCNGFLFITEELARQKSTKRDPSNKIYESIYHEIIYSLEHLLNDSVDMSEECTDADNAYLTINECHKRYTFDEFIDSVFDKQDEFYVHGGNDGFYTKEQVLAHMFWMYSRNSHLFSDNFEKASMMNKLS